MRFRNLDRYRVRREWDRYEGNALRDLFRTLRTRFLERNRPATAFRSLDLGSGPGRFAPSIGARAGSTVLVDLSLEALRAATIGLRSARGDRFAFVRGDARKLPFSSGAFDQAVVLGNLLGVSGNALGSTVLEIDRVVAPDGHLIIEIVPGAGDRCAYLARLPPGAVRRVLGSPHGWLTARIEREGFRPSRPAPHSREQFRRISLDEIRGLLGARWTPREILAVAPALGFDPQRLEAVRTDPDAWERLLLLEEELGHAPARWANAASLLVAFDRIDAERGLRPSHAER